VVLDVEFGKRARVRRSRFDGGRAKRAEGFNEYEVDDGVYRARVGDDVEVQFIPRNNKTTERSGLFATGTVTVEVPGSATTTTLQRAMKALDNLGLDTAPPTPDYEEFLYLHRSIYANNHHTDPDYVRILAAPGTDAERVAQIKAWAGTKYKVNFDDPKYYNPHGEAKAADGSGMRHWYRWDLPPGEVEEQMETYVLQHTMAGNLSQTPVGRTAAGVDAILSSGGELTATGARIRKGVPLGDGGSETGDMYSGGASYIFTRIRKRDATTEIRGLFFKPSRLARQDMVSYSGDRYGRINAIGERNSKIREWKAAAGNGTNEAIFKESLHILDDLAFIRVHDEAERDALLAVFAKHKITRLKDGRAVEDIIVTQYQDYTGGYPKEFQ
jgi:hypothetical protein